MDPKRTVVAGQARKANAVAREKQREERHKLRAQARCVWGVGVGGR